MRKLTKIIAIALILALALTATGCSLVSVDEDKDRAQVIATVDGTDITKGEVMDTISMNAIAYGYPADYFFSEEVADQLEDIKRSALDQVILETVIESKAKELGLNEFSDEELVSFTSQAEEYITSVKGQLELQVVQEFEAMGLTAEEAEVNSEIQRRLDEWLAGFATTEEEFPKLFKNEEVFLRVQDYLFGDIEVSEEEVKSFYDTSLKEQEEALVKSPEFYEFYIQAGTLMVYEPFATNYVRHILVSILEEDQGLSTEAQSLNYSAETDEEKNAAMSIMDPAFKNILPKIEEIQQKIADGEDFGALIEEYGEDPGMESNPEGYAVKTGEGIYVQSFEDAAMALTTPGQKSEPVKSFFGYHILELISIDPAGAIPYEDVQASIQQKLLNDEQTKTWTEKTDEWVAATEVVEYLNKLK